MRNDIPSERAPNFNARLRETVMTYLGKQGDPLDRGVTLRDLIESGFATLRPGRIGSGPAPLIPGGAIDPGTEPDLTPPPTPSGFALDAAISSVFITHDRPIYTQGHGHLRTRVYGKVVQAGDPLPLFADAVEITQFSGTVFAYATNPSTTWHMWIKWETVDGVLSPTPAGGTNGLSVTTGQDVGLLLDALTGQITESELYSGLASRIDLVDGPSSLTGSVAARLLAESTARTNAIQSEATTRAQAILDEAAARTSGDNALQTQINTLVAGGSGDFGELLAALQEEQTARIAGDAAEASSRQTLAAQLRGDYTGTDPTALTTGILYNERQARVSAEGVISSNLSALSATVTNNYSTLNAAITSEQTARANADSALSTNLTSLTATVNTKNRSFYQSTAPTATATGDLWFDTANGNKAYRWSGSTWQPADDTRLASNAAAITAEQTARANADSSLSASITTLTTTTNGNTTSIQTLTSTTNGLSAQYTVKVDNAGLISGFGLASSAVNSTPTSDFGVLATKFWVSPPATAQATAPTTNLYVGYVWLDTSVTPNVKRYYTGSAWSTTPTRLPFIVQTTATTINGVSVPAGVYMDTAFIRDGTITNAKIGNATIDNAKIANLDASKINAGTIAADRLDANTITAKVLSVDWAKITNASVTSAQIQDAAITTAKIASTIQSTTFTSTAGWQINKAGTATFNEVALRGAINGGSYTGYAWPTSGMGFHLGPSGLLLGNANLGKYLQFDVASGNLYAPQFSIVNGSATFSGALSGASGTFSGTVSAGNVIGALMRAVTVPSSYSGIAYETSGGVVTSATATPWSLNGSAASHFLVWNGTMPAPEGSVAHKVVATATVTARNNRGSSSGDLIVKVVRVDSYSGYSATGEVIAEATTSSPYNFSLSISGASAITHTTAQTIAIFVTGFNSSNTITTYSGLFWGVR